VNAKVRDTSEVENENKWHIQKAKENINSKFCGKKMRKKQRIHISNQTPNKPKTLHKIKPVMYSIHKKYLSETPPLFELIYHSSCPKLST
jgi:hypothetical protein